MYLLRYALQHIHNRPADGSGQALWTGPMSQLERKQLGRALDQCLCTLSKPPQAVFAFCNLDEAPRRDVTRWLGAPTATSTSCYIARDNEAKPVWSFVRQPIPRFVPVRRPVCLAPLSTHWQTLARLLDDLGRSARSEQSGARRQNGMITLACTENTLEAHRHLATTLKSMLNHAVDASFFVSISAVNPLRSLPI